MPIILSGPAAAAGVQFLEFDAAGSNVDGTDPGSPLLIMDPAAGYGVTQFNSPAPAPKLLWGSSIDTDGARRADPSTYENRTVSLTVETFDTSGSTVNLDALAGKVAKLHRHGGTLKWTRLDGSIRIFDILASDGYSPTIDIRHENGRTEVQLSFLALPGMRGTEVDLGDNTETTLPCLIFAEASIPGDLTALGRLVIDNDVAADQSWVTWGLESRDYSSSANAALFYEAESRTALSGSTTVAGPAGASGAGSNVMRNTELMTDWQAVLSTQATGGGAHLSHVGTFRVYARVQPASNGDISVALEWGEGDFRRYTRNPAKVIDSTMNGTWRLIDLGLVTLSRVPQGTQRWEGRIVAKSTQIGDDIDVDWLALVPVAEGSGTASSVIRQFTSTAFAARDEFNQTAGALSGKTLPVGGTWGGAGDADDFNVTGTGTVTRTAVTDASSETGRYALAGATTYGAISVAGSLTVASNSLAAGAGFSFGVFARYVDTNNWLMARLMVTAFGTADVRVEKRVAGVTSILASQSVSINQNNLPRRITLNADTAGNYSVWHTAAGAAAGEPLLTGTDSVLATAGALATGRIGMYDAFTNSGAWTRTYDDFVASVPPAQDAAVYASQSIEVRHNAVLREDSTGSFWQTSSSYEGDYLAVPPSGAEARTVRMIVKASRSKPLDGADSATDDVSARLFVTPRYL